MPAERSEFFAPRAWVGGAWAENVRLVAEAGHWREVVSGSTAPAGATRLPGAVLPGLANAHSHAFQRAMAGLAERSTGGSDNFWLWRDRMYRVALRITPAQLEAVAAFLYAELLQAGYTQVCEFHYLHNQPDGADYADPLEMSLALVRAAQSVGIGLTLLPTLYMRSGFGAAGLRDDQRRFASTPASVLRIAEAVQRQAGADGLVNTGVALHSLRAVDEGALRETAAAARGLGLPVHLHVAEQQQEVHDCLAHHGQRPVEWLLGQGLPDARWNLVHATQATPPELQGARDAGAAVVICPTTEANLGDGVFDLPGWLGRGGTWSIGSDSHVSRSWQDELRLLEYSQRLTLRERNVAARAAAQESTAAALFDGALAGGSAAAGRALGGLAVGQRADFFVLDEAAPALAGIPPGQLLDAAVFSADARAVTCVHVGGRPAGASHDAAGFRRAMHALWAP